MLSVSTPTYLYFTYELGKYIYQVSSDMGAMCICVKTVCGYAAKQGKGIQTVEGLYMECIFPQENSLMPINASLMPMAFKIQVYWCG